MMPVAPRVLALFAAHTVTLAEVHRKSPWSEGKRRRRQAEVVAVV